jgi:hypothetical protein
MTDFVTRQPTGRPPWPLILLAGAEKTGKSWSWAEFSGSPLIDRTFVVEVGEGAADMYGAMPGARFEIVEHDGSYRAIKAALEAASTQPTSGLPHCIVLDSATELWDLLTDEQQVIARARALRKGKSEDDATITMDQWNVAKKRWRDAIDVLRGHNGPVIVTARFEQVAVMGPTGQPTTDKTWKIRAEKNLPFEVDAVVQMPRPRTYYLTGVRSMKLQLPPGEHLEYPTFTVERLLTDLGLAMSNTAQRSYTAPQPDAYANELAEQQKAEQKALAAQLRAGKPPKTDGPRALADLPRNANGAVNLSAITNEERALYGLGQDNPDHDALIADVQSNDRPAVRSDTPSEVDELFAAPEPITPPQLTKLHILLKEKGITGRVDALRLASSLASRPIESTKDLTKSEARLFIDSLESGGWTQLDPALAALVGAA